MNSSLLAVGVSCVTHCTCMHCIDKTFNHLQTKRKSTTFVPATCRFLEEVIFHAKNGQTTGTKAFSRRKFANNVSRGSQAAKTAFKPVISLGTEISIFSLKCPVTLS